MSIMLFEEATLLSGGSIVNPEGKGEVRGDSIVGGSSATMQPGDVVYVPAAAPHQVQIKSGTTFHYVALKVPAKD